MQIEFVQVPDAPRATRTPSKSGKTVRQSAQAALLEQFPAKPAVKYDAPETQSGNVKWLGYCLSWADKINFGRRIPGPHPVYFTCWAPTKDAAETILNMKRLKLGYALGGLKGVRRWQEGDPNPRHTK